MAKFFKNIITKENKKFETGSPTSTDFVRINKKQFERELVPTPSSFITKKIPNVKSLRSGFLGASQVEQIKFLEDFEQISPGFLGGRISKGQDVSSIINRTLKNTFKNLGEQTTLLGERQQQLRQSISSQKPGVDIGQSRREAEIADMFGNIEKFTSFLPERFRGQPGLEAEQAAPGVSGGRPEFQPPKETPVTGEVSDVIPATETPTPDFEDNINDNITSLNTKLQELESKYKIQTETLRKEAESSAAEAQKQKDIFEDLQKQNIEKQDPTQDSTFEQQQRIAQNQLDAAEFSSNQIQKQFKEKLTLTNRLETLLTEGNNLITQMQGVTGLASIRNPRIAQAIDAVNAEVSVIQAVLEARDGNINAAHVIINNAVILANDNRQQLVDYYTKLESFYENAKNEEGIKLINLKAEEKAYLKEQRTTAQAEIERVRENADFIKNAIEDDTTAVLYGKAGITTNDTPEQRQEKLTRLAYVDERRGMDNTMADKGFEYMATPEIRDTKDPAGLTTRTDSRGNTRTYWKKPEVEEVEKLTANEAANLNLPFGTTVAEAESLGLIPKSDLTTAKKAELEIKLANNFEQFAKESRGAVTQIGLMQDGLAAAEIAAGTGGNLNPASQAILVTFQKVLDPTSVVRESEYARSASGESLVNRIKGFADKIKQGGPGVTIESLREFVKLGESFMKGYQENQLNFARRTQKQATNNNLNIENILTPDVIDLLDSFNQESVDIISSGGEGWKSAFDGF